MDTTYYTVKEVAGILRISVSTVRRAVKAGGLRAARVGSQGQLRVAESELARYVDVRVNGSGHGASAARLRDDAHVSTPPADRLTGASLFTIDGATAKGTPWKVINADVVEGLRLIDDGSVNCIVTSPPYYWQRDYEVANQIGHEESIDGYVQSLVGAFSESKRVLAPDGVLFLNLGDTYYSAKGRPHGRDDKHRGRQMARRQLRAVDGPSLGLPRKSLIGIPWRVALALQADGWTLRSAVIWQRRGSLPEPTARDRPWRTYEHIFIFSKSTRYWFDRSALNGDEDVWQIVARPENPGAHFAPYPRELVDRCLSCGCPPGGVVLDPFVGSGTTILSALHRDSSSIGIELNPEYCSVIKERITSEFGGTSSEAFN